MIYQMNAIQTFLHYGGGQTHLPKSYTWQSILKGMLHNNVETNYKPI